MEFFPDGLAVRLRSRIRGGGLYLYARDDGSGVSLSPRRSSPNTEWEVRRLQREGTDDFFVLRSSATGRCLAAPAGDTTADPRCKRRSAAIQRDYVEGQRATAWRATWAGLRHGDVILRDFFFGRKLCAEEDARHGNRVFVQLAAGRGKNTKTRTASASHWFVEAALPLPLRPAPPKDPLYSRLYVPRLTLDTAASARLPILGARNQLLGYLPASSVIGLRQLVDGSGGGQMLHADVALVAGEARNGQLVTALALVAGMGKGITTLPIHLQDAPALLDLEEHRALEENVGQAANDLDEQDEHAAQAEEQAMQLLQIAQDGLQADQGDVVNAEAAEDQNAGDHVVAQLFLQAAEGDVQAEAAEGHNAGDNAVAHQIENTLSSLDDAYQVMVSRHQSISRLIEKGRATAEEAAARQDWSGVDKVHRSLDKSIHLAIATYDKADIQAAGLRDSLVRLSVRQPPSPPPLLRRHPAHLLRRRRG